MFFSLADGVSLPNYIFPLLFSLVCMHNKHIVKPYYQIRVLEFFPLFYFFLNWMNSWWTLNNIFQERVPTNECETDEEEGANIHRFAKAQLDFYGWAMFRRAHLTWKSVVNHWHLQMMINDQNNGYICLASSWHDMPYLGHLKIVWIDPQLPPVNPKNSLYFT